MNLFSMSISISRLYGPDRPHSETLFVYVIIVIKKRVMKQRTAKTPFEQIDWNSGLLHCNFDCFLEKWLSSCWHRKCDLQLVFFSNAPGTILLSTLRTFLILIGKEVFSEYRMFHIPYYTWLTRHNWKNRWKRPLGKFIVQLGFSRASKTAESSMVPTTPILAG